MQNHDQQVPWNTQYRRIGCYCVACVLGPMMIHRGIFHGGSFDPHCPQELTCSRILRTCIVLAGCPSRVRRGYWLGRDGHLKVSVLTSITFGLTWCTESFSLVMTEMLSVWCFVEKGSDSGLASENYWQPWAMASVNSKHQRTAGASLTVTQFQLESDAGLASRRHQKTPDTLPRCVLSLCQ